VFISSYKTEAVREERRAIAVGSKPTCDLTHHAYGLAGAEA
jgi:hypothetical protein